MKRNKLRKTEPDAEQSNIVEPSAYMMDDGKSPHEAASYGVESVPLSSGHENALTE